MLAVAVLMRGAPMAHVKYGFAYKLVATGFRQTPNVKKPFSMSAGTLSHLSVHFSLLTWIF